MNTAQQPSRPPKPVSAYRAAPRTFNTATPSCPRCDKSVYAAEQALGPGGREYHKRCLTCIACKKAVAPGTFEEHEGDPYCKHCYNKSFGPKGYGHGGAMIGEYHDPLINSGNRSPFSSPARTNSRTSMSYESPGRVSSNNYASGSGGAGGRDSPLGGTSASTSGRTTIESPMSKYRSSRLQDLEDEGIAESEDYNNMYMDDNNSTHDAGEPDRTIKRINRSQVAEAPDFGAAPSPPPSPSKNPPSFSSYQQLPYRPRSLSPTKSSSSSYTTPAAMQQRPDSPASSSSVGTESTSTSSGNNNSGIAYRPNLNLGILGGAGPDQCRRCGTTVYFAEKVVASGHKWHKRCLRCANCSKALDSHLVEKDNLPYCKKCYDEQWGMRSQGFILRPSLH